MAKSLNPLPEDKAKKITQELEEGLLQIDLAANYVNEIKRNKEVVEPDLNY